MAKARRITTNFSKGVLSPLLEGRPDLAAYFEGAARLDNWLILRQGGVTRRPGTRMIAEAKVTDFDVILLPFEFSVDDSFVIEAGHDYFRFYKNKARVEQGGVPVEVISPYPADLLRGIHFTQSADIMFLFHSERPQHQLARVSDVEWTLSPIAFNPPPSFEADADISDGVATLTPAATTGFGVTFTASAPVFLQADVGRQIIYRGSRADITTFISNTQVTADIINSFPSTAFIPPGQWFLRLSPRSDLDPDKKGPIGHPMLLVASIPTFRASDVGKYIHIFGGVVRIIQFDSVTNVIAFIHSELISDDTDPPAALAGTWTLEYASWSTLHGFPRTGEFYEGRLGQASTASQPTTFWLSVSDDFTNYASGTEADDAIEYTIASRRINRIEWLADYSMLFIGTSGAEFKVSGQNSDDPLGGDQVPHVKRFTAEGSAPVQPLQLARQLIYLDRSRKKIFTVAFSIESDNYDSVELTAVSEHITSERGIQFGPMAFANRPDPRGYFLDGFGDIVALTYFINEKVVGFTKITTDGIFLGIAVIPGSNGKPDQVWTVVLRTINGAEHRFIEMFEPDAEELVTKHPARRGFQTDCAKFYSGPALSIIPGFEHLAGETVDVLVDGSYVGQRIVSPTGTVEMDEPSTNVEIGLHYESEGITMRPAIEGSMIEGMPRSWDSMFLRLNNTIGGEVNGQWILYAEPNQLYTGDKKLTGIGWDTDGRITFAQRQPYPMTVLSLFGTLSVGDRD